MNKFITFTLALFAYMATGSYAGAPYGGASVQQVHSSLIPNIEQYFNSGSPSYVAPAAPIAAPHISYGPSSYGPSAPSYAPATSVVLPAPSSYSAPTSSHSSASSSASPSSYPGPSSYAAPSSYPASASYSSSPSYSAAPSYKQSPKIGVQPAFSTHLYAGQNNYKAYVAPTTYNKVSLPIVPSDPVAKLYVPQQHSYAAAPQPSYPSLSSYGSPISISSGL